MARTIVYRSPIRRWLHSPSVAAAMLVFLTTGYFRNSRPGWNVNSQLALTRAVVEHGTLSIDAYHDSADMPTGDKALHDGHYYTDKSPVTPFLGVPAYWFHHRFMVPEGEPPDIGRARWWVTWWTIGLAAVAFVIFLTILFERRGIDRITAPRAAALWIAATPLLGYSVLFTNYLPAAALSLGAYLLLDRSRFALSGFLVGLATWTLNTVGLVGLVLTVKPARGARTLIPWIAGGLLGVAGYFLYTWSIFGTIASPYSYEESDFFREQMSRGFMGATWPRPTVTWLVTFHPFHGLFLWWPLTLVALAGCVTAAVRGKGARRFDGRVGLAVFLGLLIYTSGYFLWWGGWAYAPRHLIPALPFLALGLVPVLANPSGRLLVLVTAGFSAVLNAAAVAIDPQTAPGGAARLTEETLMTLKSVETWPSTYLSLQRDFWHEGAVDHNWGTSFGLPGAASLIPLVVLWLVVLAGLGSAWFGPPPLEEGEEIEEDGDQDQVPEAEEHRHVLDQPPQDRAGDVEAQRPVGGG